MITWADVKRKVEQAGVKDDDHVRSFDIFFSIDRVDYTHIFMKQPPERSRSINAAVQEVADK